MSKNGILRGYGDEESDERQDRAEEIKVLRVYEVRPDLYRVKFKSDDGEKRTLLLAPKLLMSSSPDMMWNPNDGVVGKYLRAFAMDNEAYAAKLRKGIEAEQARIQKDIDDHNAEVRTLSGEHRKLETVLNDIE